MRPRSSMFVAVGLVAIVLLPACVRRAMSHDDAGGTGQVGIDGGLDARGAITCGAVTCTGTDLCVMNEGCGGPLNCSDKPDGGPCPGGTTEDQRCLSAFGRPGCIPNCAPPSYGCAPRPAACNDQLDCSCIDRSVCTAGVCLGIQGARTVECGFE
jgi:hypothetical protein